MVVSGIYLCMTIVNNLIIPSLSITGVTIRMTEIQKQVTEGGTVMVCATLTGQLGRSVVVGLTSAIGTGKY